METLGNPTIADQATYIFAHHPHLARRKLRCRTENERVILEGQVDSFFEKQLAQEALRDLQGDRPMDNCLTISPSQSH